MPSANQEGIARYRIMLVDDHALFRAGFRLVLINNPRIASEIREAGSVTEALAILRGQEDPDLILLDIAMPGINGLSGMRLLRQASPDATIALLSANDHPQVIQDALSLGASGFLSKESDADTVTRAIDRLLDGQPCFPQLAKITATPEDRPSPATQLTPRQLEVLALMGEGLTNKVIARRLSIAENTVRAHVSAILSHMGVTTRMEAVYTARSLSIMK
jgi:DNA-binding NarL/FixJ family response regulator